MRKKIVEPLPFSIAVGFFGRGEAWGMYLEGANRGEQFPVTLQSMAYAGCDTYEFAGIAGATGRPVRGHVSPNMPGESWIEID